MRSEERLQEMIDIIPVLAWSARNDGTVEFLNRPWLDYTGLTLEEASGWGWAQALHPDDLNAVVNYWKSLVESGEAGEVEARIRRRDGVFRWFLFRASPLCGRAWYAHSPRRVRSNSPTVALSSISAKRSISLANGLARICFNPRIVQKKWMWGHLL